MPITKVSIPVFKDWQNDKFQAAITISGGCIVSAEAPQLENIAQELSKKVGGVLKKLVNEQQHTWS